MTFTQVLFTAFVAAVGLERLAEMVVSKRHADWAFARGAVESGRGHFPVMVLLHTALLAGAVVEVVVADRPFLPLLGWPMLALVVLAQGLRWWCITALGPHWNTRVIVVPGAPLVASGPYRILRHPNYVAVVVEGVALPLVHTAWVTATAFTVLNLLLLSVRIHVEEQALGLRPGAT
jgi:methyltransferase